MDKETARARFKDRRCVRLFPSPPPSSLITSQAPPSSLERKRRGALSHRSPPTHPHLNARGCVCLSDSLPSPPRPRHLIFPAAAGPAKTAKEDEGVAAAAEEEQGSRGLQDLKVVLMVGETEEGTMLLPPVPRGDDNTTTTGPPPPPTTTSTTMERCPRTRRPSRGPPARTWQRCSPSATTPRSRASTRGRTSIPRGPWTTSKPWSAP
jgi:hypothetical protein